MSSAASFVPPRRTLPWRRPSSRLRPHSRRPLSSSSFLTSLSLQTLAPRPPPLAHPSPSLRSRRPIHITAVADAPCTTPRATSLLPSSEGKGRGDQERAGQVAAVALADPPAPSSDLGLRVLLLGGVTIRAACSAPAPWPARDAALPPAPTLTLGLQLLVKVHARVQRRTLAAPHGWHRPQHLWLAEAHRRLPLPPPLVDKLGCSDLDEQQQLLLHVEEARALMAPPFLPPDMIMVFLST